MVEEKCFKKCPSCEKTWETRYAFLADPAVALVSYEVNFKNLGLGKLYFNHQDQAGTSTFPLPAQDFMDLFDGPVFIESKKGTDECPALCLHKEQLGRCTVSCECASVREVMHRITTWPKKQL